jgi:putative transcriptional regulator
MRDELFQELVESIRDTGAYLRGEKAPARVTFLGEPDPREVRARTGMTQAQFAKVLGVSIKTLRNWEQGHRDPDSPAMMRLKVIAENPGSARDAA